MEKLHAFIAASMARDVPPEVQGLTHQILARQSGVLAVISYGSTLRNAPTQDTLIDFYVLVESISDVASNPFFRIVSSLAPPNVYYFEAPIAETTYRAKYAVLTLKELRKRVSASTGNPYFWARFAQPTVLVYARDDTIRCQIYDATVLATQTAFGHAKSIAPHADAVAQWKALFSETYKTEFRPEGPGRAASVVDLQRDYYEQISILLKDTTALSQSWPLARLFGKILTLCRLVKAAFTFSGGVDYVVWKIQRHSGVRVELSPWQKKHPIVAGFCLLPRLLLRGTIR
jgi:hypothetical protein